MNLQCLLKYTFAQQALAMLKRVGIDLLLYFEFFKFYKMAKQSSIFKLKGTIDGVTFYKTSKDGHLAKAKGGVPKSRILNDPKFARTRENMSEFSNAGKSGKVLRDSIESIVNEAKDNRMVSRLVKEMVSIGHTDITNPRGQRHATFGQLQLLKGFEFNSTAKLTSILSTPYKVTMNRVTGLMQIDIPSFVPKDTLKFPQGAMTFRIVSAATEVDFIKTAFNSDIKHSVDYFIDNTPTPPFQVGLQLTANSTLPLFVVLGFQFFNKTNNQFYSLRNGAFNCLAIVDVNQP